MDIALTWLSEALQLDLDLDNCTNVKRIGRFFQFGNHTKSKKSPSTDFKKFVCNLCDFISQFHIEKCHMMAKPKEEGYINYACYICNYIASEKVSLLKHIKAKHGDNKYACNQNKCKYQAINQAALEVHFESIHAVINQRLFNSQVSHKQSLKHHYFYPCKLCDFQAKSKKLLNSHLRIHDGIKFDCNQCDYKGPQRCLQRHICPAAKGKVFV